MSTTTINVAEDFSEYPHGRRLADGPNSAERFRKEHLVPALEKYDEIVIILDDVMGYPASFTEEAFGGLVREEKFDADELAARIKVKASPVYVSYLEDIFHFIKQAGLARQSAKA